jgi:NAD(P)-dependent dehydrogenase (short-subunit alcohol dehydrogenase family)
VRVVVTGAAGFIGSHVAQAMARAGHEVLAVDALHRSTAPSGPSVRPGPRGGELGHCPEHGIRLLSLLRAADPPHREESRVKIPKHVNTVWDWVDAHIRLLILVATLAIVAVAGLWIPLLSVFVLGAIAGGLAVQSRIARRVTRLRAEVDELLRENGALRHEKTMLSSHVITSGTLLTQRLPVIREAWFED